MEHNSESLRVLRCLLSHVIVRHSKEQNSEGKAMVALPPRTVTTVIIPFGSEHEQNLYDTLETRSQQRFQELRRESVDVVLSKYVELTGMMLGARQACSHTSNVDLDRFECLDNSLDRQSKIKNQTKDSEQPAVKIAVGTQLVEDRAFILTRAVKWAPESAKSRVWQVILQFQEGEVELMECQICLEPFSETEAAITECGHCSCKDCILSLLEASNGHSRCPTCRADIGRDTISFLGDAKDAGQFQARPKQGRAAPNANINVQVNGFLMTANDLHANAASDSKARRSVWEPLTEGERLDQRAYLSTFSQPVLDNRELAAGSIGTKVSCLLQEIKEMIHKDPANKAVVFSQFDGTLDCVAQELAARDIRFVPIDDNMKQHERADALSNFSTDPNVKVFLLSMTRAGGGAMGLNLTAASWCFILDTPMNSAVEEQAISRVHRLGSNTPVVVVVITCFTSLGTMSALVTKRINQTW